MLKLIVQYPGFVCFGLAAIYFLVEGARLSRKHHSWVPFTLFAVLIVFMAFVWVLIGYIASM